jgi:hypothetical protein
MSDSDAIAKVIAIFEKLSQESRERVFQTVSAYLGFGGRASSGQAQPVANRPTSGSTLAPFAEDRSLSAKEFMRQKQPVTDVERVACLAYYLTHYLNTPHFKTLDISRLNTEAAQIKFSNPAVAANNAIKLGYLTAAQKGAKQLSALGEEFVGALPDRAAAKQVMASVRKRRGSKKERRSAPNKSK